MGTSFSSMTSPRTACVKGKARAKHSPTSRSPAPRGRSVVRHRSRWLHMLLPTSESLPVMVKLQMSSSNYAFKVLFLRSFILLGRFHRPYFDVAVIAAPTQDVRKIPQPRGRSFCLMHLGFQESAAYQNISTMSHEHAFVTPTNVPLLTGTGPRSYRGQAPGGSQGSSGRMPFSAPVQQDFQRSHWPEHNTAQGINARFRPGSFPQCLGPEREAPVTRLARGERTITSTLSLIP